MNITVVKSIAWTGKVLVEIPGISSALVPAEYLGKYLHEIGDYLTKVIELES